MATLKLACIPFSGFYNSIHDGNLDDALSQSFSDENGNTYDGLVSRAFDLINWQAAQQAYSKGYAENFGQAFNIKGLIFDELNSPREYNFTTDRVFVKLPLSEVFRIKRETPRAMLEAQAREMFTSCSGFISHYSPDVSSWGAVSTWDHNQLLALISAYVLHMRDGKEFDQWAEHDLMSDDQCNGQFDNWLFEKVDDKIKRLWDVSDYLRQRQQRAYRVGV